MTIRVDLEGVQRHAEGKFVQDALADRSPVKDGGTQPIDTADSPPLTCIPKWDTMYPRMAYKATTIEDLLAIMKRVQGEKTLTQFAAELDLSKQYLSNVYNRHKEPSERLLDKLGFTRQTTYVRSPTAARKEKKK